MVRNKKALTGRDELLVRFEAALSGDLEFQKKKEIRRCPFELSRLLLLLLLFGF